MAKIEVMVVDAENERPVEGIEVVASFSNDNGWKAWTESAPINHDRKLTDHHGRCYLSGKTNNGDITLKQGYGYVVGGVEFLYYLNPTPNDCNLEWDMKHNLCSAPGNIGKPQP
jgi:hypothetical protein